MLSNSCNNCFNCYQNKTCIAVSFYKDLLGLRSYVAQRSYIEYLMYAENAILYYKDALILAIKAINDDKTRVILLKTLCKSCKRGK